MPRALKLRGLPVQAGENVRAGTSAPARPRPGGSGLMTIDTGLDVSNT